MFDNEWHQDISKAQRALEIAKQKAKKNVVPITLNDYTVVYVTEEQAKDEDYVFEMRKRYAKSSIYVDR